MTDQKTNPDPTNHLGPLDSLPTCAATEFDGWHKGQEQSAPSTGGTSTPERPAMPFENDREYRLCKQVIQYPLKPSSQYAKLAGISSKTAQPLRQKLVARGFIRERAVDAGKRGPSTILLEALPAGVRAVAQYEARSE